MRILGENPQISGSILPEKIELLALKGIQFTGKMIPDHSPGQKNPDIYHKRYPLALAKPGNVCCIELLKLKMSDNTNIFGKKLNWERGEEINEDFKPVRL